MTERKLRAVPGGTESVGAESLAPNEAMEALLAPDRLRTEGFFDPAPIRAKWDEHQSGERNWHYYLWDVLMFQAWFEAGG